MIGGVLMVTEGSCLIVWSIYLRFISQNTFYFVYYAGALGIIATVLSFFIPESPRYLYGANNLKGCTEVLQLIAKRNGVVGYDTPKFDAEYEIVVENADGLDSQVPEDGIRASDGAFDSLLSKRDG